MRIFWPLLVRAAKLPDCAPREWRASSSIPNSAEKTLTFENNSPWTLEVVWMDFEGSPHQVNSMFESGGEHREDTYTGHVFEFRLDGKTIDFHQVSPEVDVYKV